MSESTRIQDQIAAQFAAVAAQKFDEGYRAGMRSALFTPEDVAFLRDQVEHWRIVEEATRHDPNKILVWSDAKEFQPRFKFLADRIEALLAAKPKEHDASPRPPSGQPGFIGY